MATHLITWGNRIQIQESQRAPNKTNPKRPTPRHITIKMSKVKEENPKNSKRKQLMLMILKPISRVLGETLPAGNGTGHSKC